MLDQERMGGGEEQEGVVGGEAIIKKYYMRKYFFQILKIKRRKDLKEKMGYSFTREPWYSVH